jgi:hypothetical protein
MTTSSEPLGQRARTAEADVVVAAVISYASIRSRSHACRRADAPAEPPYMSLQRTQPVGATYPVSGRMLDPPPHSGAYTVRRWRN